MNSVAIQAQLGKMSLRVAAVSGTSEMLVLADKDSGGDLHKERKHFNVTRPSNTQ